MNRRGDTRISTNDGYLEPARGRDNLTIIGDALVDSIEFDGTRAVAVRVRTREAPVDCMMLPLAEPTYPPTVVSGKVQKIQSDEIEWTRAQETLEACIC
ncbi:MAG: hypothetical protein ACLQAT_25585 [Candidatus Binataceae bacterium]